MSLCFIQSAWSTAGVFSPTMREGPRPGRTATRPGCLTAVCLFLGFGALVWLVLAFTYAGPRGRWYPAHLFFQALAVAVAVFGLWTMRKWGVVALGVVAFLILVLYAATGLLNVETILIYAVTLGPGVYYYNRMR